MPRGVDTDIEYTQPLEGHKKCVISASKRQGHSPEHCNFHQRKHYQQTTKNTNIHRHADQSHHGLRTSQRNQRRFVPGLLHCQNTGLEASRKTLEQENLALLDQLDKQEQYSRRKCLVFHGVTEQQKDTTTAVTVLCSRSLGVTVDSRSIDHSHLLRKPNGDKSVYYRNDSGMVNGWAHCLSYVIWARGEYYH